MPEPERSYMATTDSFQGYMFQGFSGLMRKLKGEKSFESDKDFIHTYRAVCEATLGKSFDEATPQERYTALARMVAFKARDLQVESNVPKEKRVYYFSLEFLLGPLLDNYLINLGVRDVVADGHDRLAGGTYVLTHWNVNLFREGHRNDGLSGSILTMVHMDAIQMFA